MEKETIITSLFLLVALLHGSCTQGSSDNERKAYIVYMGDAKRPHMSAVHHHHSLLSSVIGDEDIARELRIHSYGKSFDAFAAHLSPKEAKRLEENENVVSVFSSTIRKLRTTRSWDFLRMPLSVMKRNSQRESDIIVGVFDTGVYIDAPSFNDKGFGPPPSKWRGACELGGNFTGCNNKVIGARVYNLDKINLEPNPSPADVDGHGTHTSSTVAGIPVRDASLYGLGQGTARGGVPSARLAIYKVCSDFGCSDIDLMAAFDDAIQDGIDLISMSIGGPVSDYFTDVIAIGSFHAMRKGILSSVAAGNEGPYPASVENVAPWILTVGASGMDRQFRTPVRLGNGMKTSGISINTFTTKARMYPLTSASKAWNYSSGIDPQGLPGICDSSTLDKNKVKGKIVLCRGGSDDALKEMGGVGMIIAGDSFLDTGFTFVIPATFIDAEHGDQIDKYINSTKNPQATIFKSRTVKVAAPFVASFSSRGPNFLSPTILKPDIVAPGVDILAAYSKLVSVTGYNDDNRFDVYNIISGTSMATPHASAAAAYVKSFNPEWSPAAIKSALMTTASEIKVKDELAELSYGAGQIDPTRAVNPGLVYDMSEVDYIRFLCKEGYSGIALSMVTGEKTDCSSVPSYGGHDDINYPSMHFQVKKPNSSFSVAFLRTLTYVGSEKTIYKAVVKGPKGLEITVSPDRLVFNHVNQKKSFKVMIKGPPMGDASVLSASLEWIDSDGHKVKSPIAISTQLTVV